MEKIVITQFSDPMMGLAWECEPALQRVVERYGDGVELRDCMGVPMHMEGFSLFAPDRRSSLPLCLAYEAAKLAAPGQARAFLLRLREATVWECRPTTKPDEIMRVVRLCGIDGAAFQRHLEDGSAQVALEQDARFKNSLGIHALPAFLVECGDRATLIRGVADYDTLARAIEAVV